ncbi:MAG: tetratricopeptide repeat protein [Actinobacteria bacterium]|nr:tetratricopeptide repeat protein [Actinomycetota bacterium]
MSSNVGSNGKNSKAQKNAIDGNDPLQQVDELIMSGREDEALAILKNQVDAGTEPVAKACCQIGVAYSRKNDFVQAEKYFVRAVKADPKLSEGFYNLGWIYQRKGDYDSALAFYKESLVERGDDGEVYEGMGDCCLALEKYDDALAFFDAALQLCPDSIHAALNLAKIYLMKNAPDNAREVLKLALISNPNETEIHFSLGAIQKEMGNYEHALAHFHKVVMYDETNTFAYNELGECCQALGLTKQAEPFFAQAAKLDETNLTPKLNLGELYYKKHCYDQTAIILQQWLDDFRDQIELENGDIDHHGELVPTLNMLADAYNKSKQLSRAKEVWQLSLEIDENQDEIKKLMNQSDVRSYDKVSLSLD